MHYDSKTDSSYILRRELRRAYSARAAQNADHRPIGIFIDSESEAPRRRAIAIGRQAPDYFTLLGAGLRGKSEALAIIDLPAAPSPAKGRHPAGAAENHRSAELRLRRIAEWIDAARPALLLIDSDPQVAELARAKNVPAVYMRLAGRRNDPAHLRAFAAAEAVLCPFHALLEAESTPQWLRRRSRYFPGLTAGGKAPAEAAPAERQPRLLLAAGYDGGGKKHMAASPARLAQMAAALPGWQIGIIGCPAPQSAGESLPAGLHFHGRAANAESFIRRADLVAGDAGDCLISAVAAAGRPFICMPRPRPYGEQYAKAERLEELGAAVICRRWPRDWAKIVAQALKRGAVLQALHEDNAAARAADFLLGLAYGAGRPQAGGNAGFPRPAIRRKAAGPAAPAFLNAPLIR